MSEVKKYWAPEIVDEDADKKVVLDFQCKVGELMFAITDTIDAIKEAAFLATLTHCTDVGQ